MKHEERIQVLEQQIGSLKKILVTTCCLTAGLVFLAANGAGNDQTSKVQIVGTIEVELTNPVKVINNSSSSSGRTFKIHQE